MNVDINVEVRDPEPGECKLMIFTDIRDTFRVIAEKAKEDDINLDFFKYIVKRMPGFARMAIERITRKYDHYLEKADFDRDTQAVMIWMKEIASMDTDLECRIKRRSIDMIDNFGAMADVQQVVTGKNAEGKYVVKLVYSTSLRPEKIDVANQYDEETGLRTSCSEPFPSKDSALYYGMWLAGALNIRHVDEDETVK